MWRSRHLPAGALRNEQTSLQQTLLPPAPLLPPSPPQLSRRTQLPALCRPHHPALLRQTRTAQNNPLLPRFLQLWPRLRQTPPVWPPHVHQTVPRKRMPIERRRTRSVSPELHQNAHDLRPPVQGAVPRGRLSAGSALPGDGRGDVRVWQPEADAHVSRL
uniref:(northern house mosquito) hypothetical protein n=1 Tax=Culex pipiens TaxID=7175 RepID=A0A8D8J5G5_CULPI